MCLKIYRLDPVKFLWAPGLKVALKAWKAAFKKDWSEIRIINWYWYAINGLKRN